VYAEVEWRGSGRGKRGDGEVSLGGEVSFSHEHMFCKNIEENKLLNGRLSDVACLDFIVKTVCGCGS